MQVRIVPSDEIRIRGAWALDDPNTGVTYCYCDDRDMALALMDLIAVATTLAESKGT